MEFVKVDQENMLLAIKLQAEIFPEEKSPDQIIKGIKFGNPINYICYDGVERTPIGIVGFYFQDNLPEHILLNWYGVLNEYRSKGYGKEILFNAIELSKVFSLPFLTFWTDKIENNVAVELYKQLKFDVVDYCCEEDIAEFTRAGIKNTFVVGCFALNSKKVDFKKVDMQISKQFQILDTFNKDKKNTL